MKTYFAVLPLQVLLVVESFRALTSWFSGLTIAALCLTLFYESDLTSLVGELYVRK